MSRHPVPQALVGVNVQYAISIINRFHYAFGVTSPGKRCRVFSAAVRTKAKLFLVDRLIG